MAALTANAVELRPVSEVLLQADTKHVQGIEIDGSRLWVTSVDAGARKGLLLEFEVSSGALRRTTEIQDGDRYHPGGLSGSGDSLWIPVAEYRRASTSVIQKRSKQSFKLERQFHVADHIGCVAATRDELVGGNWDARELYVWNAEGHLRRKVANPTDNAFQDIKFANGQLIGGGLLPDKSGAIDWIEYPAFRHIRRLKVGRTDRGTALTHEGMAIKRGRIWLLPEDNPSRLFEFAWQQ